MCWCVQGKNAVDAAKAAGIQHLVFSGGISLVEDTDKSCDIFDSKAAVEAYIKEQGNTL